MNQKKEFPTKLFIIASIANLIFLSSLFFLWRSSGAYQHNGNESRQTDINKYFFNDNTESKDPFITVVPGLDDMLAGPIIQESDPSLGSKDAKVFLVIYSDFMCSYCQNQEKVLKQIKDKYSDSVRIIWKDYPEIAENSLSWQASVAGRCADEQGKFWEYHDALFENNSNLSKEVFISLAEDLNMRVDIFSECLSDQEINQKVKDNVIEAQALGITGIPYIFVNDKEMMGEVSAEELQQLVENIINTDSSE